MVSSLPTRSENTRHVSLIENYPANLEALGEPIRQVLTQRTHTQTDKLTTLNANELLKRVNFRGNHTLYL